MPLRNTVSASTAAVMAAAVSGALPRPNASIAAVTAAGFSAMVSAIPNGSAVASIAADPTSAPMAFPSAAAVAVIASAARGTLVEPEKLEGLYGGGYGGRRQRHREARPNASIAAVIALAASAAPSDGIQSAHRRDNRLRSQRDIQIADEGFGQCRDRYRTQPASNRRIKRGGGGGNGGRDQRYIGRAGKAEWLRRCRDRAAPERDTQRWTEGSDRSGDRGGGNSSGDLGAKRLGCRRYSRGG